MIVPEKTNNVNVLMSFCFCDYLCVINVVKIVNFLNLLFQRTKRFTLAPMKMFFLSFCGHANFIRKAHWRLWSASRTLRKRTRSWCRIWCRATRKRLSWITMSLMYWKPEIIKIVGYCWWIVVKSGIRQKSRAIRFFGCFILFI